MSEKMIVRVADVMKREFDVVDGKLTVKEAMLAMKCSETRAMIVAKRDENDEYGIVLLSDIAKKVLAADRSPERMNLYEIMAKPAAKRFVKIDAGSQHRRGLGGRPMRGEY